ncbi:hypothetical protein PN36_26410 [Candidatus Thiomargarita nelsonii]|uniref:Uncharacterized protein n=1 Tax=Candidatus Thiomargarita nelsonii TaxID=1003181 RepID=A0A4E0REY1_9GAMM|nr:hypothetical protein PN36_26410 [Candidatus Thiomargarita nelsonii]
MFISDVEESIGKTFKMIHVKVPSPKTYKNVLPIDLTSIESYLRQTIDTHGQIIEQFKKVPVINDDVYMLAV